MDEQPTAPRDLTRAEIGPRLPPPRSSSFSHRMPDQRLSSGDYGLDAGDRRFAFSRQSSFRQPEPRSPFPPQRSHSFRAHLSRSDSFISIPTSDSEERSKAPGAPTFMVRGDDRKPTLLHLLMAVVEGVSSGNRAMKRLALLISLNVTYSTTELLIGIFTGRVGLISDAFHLTFGCGLLTFSLFAMAASRKKPDEIYTYGYKRLEVLAAFTNALFLLFLSFSLAVEALHAFMQDESEHKHYLIVSAVTNLLVNLIGVWFFRSYARLNIVYRNAEDMNYHSVFLHVLADSIRSAGLILASWFLSLGVENAEVLCLGLVSIAVFMVVMPLFRATGSILLQMAPTSVPSSALNKCWRQVTSLEDVSEVSDARFWELVPGHAIGSLRVQVKRGAEVLPILHYAHGLYHELGIQDLTVHIEHS